MVPYYLEFAVYEPVAEVASLSAVLQSSRASDGDTSHHISDPERNRTNCHILTGCFNRRQQRRKQLKLPEIQLDGYIESTDGIITKEDPVAFWLKSSHTILAPFAIDIFSAPSSSAAVERTFPQLEKPL